MISGAPVIIGTSIGISVAPERRDRSGPTAEECGHRALPGQGGWPWHLPLFRGGDGRPRPGAKAARTRYARSSAARRIRGLLPTDLRPGDRPDRLLRGAAALEPSAPRHDSAGRFHSARRGDRPDRPDRQLGAAAGLHATLPRWSRGCQRSRSICRRAQFKNRRPGAFRDRGAVGHRACRPIGWNSRSRSRFSCRTARRHSRSCTSFATSAYGSRWMISAPAIPR